MWSGRLHTLWVVRMDEVLLAGWLTSQLEFGDQVQEVIAT
jgi:hypothetical protein